MEKLLKEILKELKAIRKELKRNSETTVSISPEKLTFEEEDSILYISGKGMGTYERN